MGNPEALGRALREVVSRGDFVVPPYPAVALRLQRILASPSYGVGDVADVIAADPALAATLLASANSALQGGAREITTLGRAVNQLGARRVSSLALAAGLGAQALTSGLLFDVKYRAWRRSVTCALTCQNLAAGRGLDVEQSFLLGLLHGFGRSVAIASLEKLVQSHKPSRPLSASEWLGIAERHRSELAQAIAERWKLPQEIATAFGPVAPDDARGRLLVDADQVAAQIDAGETPGAPQPSEAESFAHFLRGLPQALLALAPAPATVARPNDAVAQPGPSVSCNKKPVALPVADLRIKSPATLTCLGIGATALEVESTRAFQESSVARVAIGQQPSLDVWLNVVSCTPRAGKYLVEMQLFSPTRELREQWQALYHAA